MKDNVAGIAICCYTIMFVAIVIGFTLFFDELQSDNMTVVHYDHHACIVRGEGFTQTMSCDFTTQKGK